MAGRSMLTISQLFACCTFLIVFLVKGIKTEDGKARFSLSGEDLMDSYLCTVPIFGAT